jgi:hypothetical protein
VTWREGPSEGRFRHTEWHDGARRDGFGIITPYGSGIGPRRTEKINNEELQNVYSSPNIIRVVKSKRMR